MSLEIRPALPADRPATFKLAANCLMTGAIVGPQELHRMACSIVETALWQHVACLGGEVSGYVWVTLSPPSTLPRMGMAVAEAFQGQGVGAALVRFIARFARDAGFKAMDLGVDSHNARAARLYERIGFREVGRVTLPGKYHLINMRLDLTDDVNATPSPTDETRPPWAT